MMKVPKRLLGASCLLLISLVLEGVESHKVAFSVASKNPQSSSSGADVVHFDETFLNAGDGFDFAENAFKCPDAGIYAFHFHALGGKDNKRFFIGLYHNGNKKVVSYANDNNDAYAMGGNTILLELQVGDKMQLKFDFGSSQIYGSSSQIYTTFSGYLIA